MFSFENINMNTNLVYKLEENDKLDHTTIGMLSNNKISNICSAKYSQVDNDIIIKFDVTSKVPAVQVFSGVLNKKWVMGLLESVYSAIIEAQKYMLDLHQFVLNLNYIFMDVSTGKMDFICLPLLNMENNDILSFIKDIIFNATFSQNEDNRYVSAIITYLNTEKKFSIDSLKKLIDSINNNRFSNTATTVQQNNISVQQNVQQNNIPVQQNVQQNNIPVQQNVQQNNIPVQQNVQQNNIPVQQNIQQNNIPVQQNVQRNNILLQQNNIPIQQYGNVQNTRKKSGNKVAVPTVQSIPNVQAEQQLPVNLQENEKKMSWLYLMCHYNKENSAKYKAQKAQKKNNASVQNSFDYSNANQNFQIPTNNKRDFARNIPQVQKPLQSVQASVPLVQNQIPQTQIPVQQMQNKSQQIPISNLVVLNNAQSVQGSVESAGNKIQNLHNQTQDVNSAVSNDVFSPNYSTTNADYGETTVLGGDNAYGETTVLGEENYQNKISPYLIRVKNNEKISINKAMFRIGKEKSYVDYFIDDNTYISRGHANILCKDGRCYIVDNNSRNHTYVNGEMITSGNEVELKNGDTIKLANEAFEFKIF